MNNNIDNLFKKALNSQKCVPPPHIWKNIEKRLDQRTRVPGIWWLRSIAAAALIVALLGIWQLSKYSSDEEMRNFVATTPLSFPSVYQENLPKITTELALLSTIDISDRKNKIEKESEKKRIISVPANILKLTDLPLLSPVNTLKPDIETRKLHRNFIPLTSKEAFKNNEQYMALLNEDIQKEKEKVTFALSGHFVPAYSSGSYSSSIKNTRGYSYSGSQMDGIMNVGGGLKISISKGKRFSFQTGIFYSRMGQKTTQDNHTPRTAALSTGPTEPRMATPLGNIKSRKKAVAYRSEEATVLNSIANTDENLEQLFGTLEIPIQVRYKLNNNKILFSIIGGFSGNFIVNNKVYLQSGNEKELLGSTENIRNFNMSTDWSLGIEYPVSRNIKIMLEPGFKYYLQSLSRNDKIDFKPYLFTLATGIGFEF